MTGDLPYSFTLRDGRIATLRATTEGDAAELCVLLPQLHIESDFLGWMTGEWNMTVQQEREFIREHLAVPRQALFCVESDGAIVAICGAQQTKFRRNAHVAEIGMSVRKAYWGQGIGRTTGEYLKEWGRNVGLRKLTLRVFDDNARAIALYRSLGFIEEGRLRQDVLRAGGGYSDTLVMGLFL